MGDHGRADAGFADAVERAPQERVSRGDTFHVVMRESPEWTRERWARAREELEQHRFSVVAGERGFGA